MKSCIPETNQNKHRKKKQKLHKKNTKTTKQKLFIFSDFMSKNNGELTKTNKLTN